MPEINGILSRNEKRLDLSKFFDGEAWITIKLIPRAIRKRITFLSSDPVFGKIAQKRISKENAVDIMADFNADELEKIQSVTKDIQDLKLESAVDPYKHNFTDSGKAVEIGGTFWEAMTETVIDFVLNEIDEFNQALTLGEANANK